MKTKIYSLIIFALAAFWGAGQLQAQTFLCPGEPLVLTLTGYTGTIQWQYSASPSGPFLPITGAAGDSATVLNANAGWYRAAVVNGTCNAFYSDTLELVVYPAVLADAGIDRSICLGESDSIGGVSPGMMGTPPYTYAWSPATGLSNTTLGNTLASPTTTTTYTLTVTDANNCTDTDDVVVTVNSLPTVSAGVDSTINCGDSLMLNGSVSAAGGTYVWSPSATITNPNSLQTYATPSASTVYVLSATDSLGCTNWDSVSITLIGVSTGVDTFEYSGVIDTTWVVPNCASTINIQVWGAQGGSNTSSAFPGGLGAYASGDFTTLATGTRLKILVGQFPGTSGNGGGGGTFVTLMNNTPLIIAGGGGGSGAANDAPSKHGQATTAGANGTGGGGLGGTNGTGGLIGASFASGAGAGLLTNGQDGWTPNSGGQAFVNGGAGANVGFGIGGFGGGGNGSGYVVGAGGGGYSGGGSGSNSQGGGGAGGGGGSYNSGTNPVTTSGVQSGNGRVIISW